jgi:hypothetical protein
MENPTKLHMTTPSRLAMTSERDADGNRTLVPSFDRVTGLQDINVAGTLVAFKPKPMPYTTAEGVAGVCYQGISLINDGSGKEARVRVLINGSAIENIERGQTYWLTERLAEDGVNVNYSQGDLLVMDAIDVSVATNRRAKLMAAHAKEEEAKAAMAKAKAEKDAAKETEDA